MKNECGLCSTSSRPAKNAALKVVVATWETPPPKSSLNTPSLMMKPLVKPFAAVRSPTVSLRLNVAPGSSRVPVDELGGPAEVLVAVLRVGEVRGERRHPLVDPEPLGRVGGEL